MCVIQRKDKKVLADRDYVKNRNVPNKKSYSLVQWITFLCVAFFIVDALMNGALRSSCLLNREDLLRGDLANATPKHIGRRRHPLHTTVAMIVRPPIQWRGGPIVEIMKKCH